MILTIHSAKDRALVSVYGFKGKHGEPSLITNVFRNLAWILITAVILFPPGLLFPPGQQYAPTGRNRFHIFESRLNWHQRSRKARRKNSHPGLGRTSVASRRHDRFSECS